MRRLAITIISISLYLSGLEATAQQEQNQAAQTQKQQYRLAVDRAKAGPFRVDVTPMQQGIRPGAPAAIKIELRNLDNELVNAREPMTFEFKANSPSHKEQIQKVTIAPNTNSAVISLTPDQAGLWKLEIKEVGETVQSGSNYLAVTSAAPSKAAPAMKKKPIQPRPPQGAFLGAPRLVLASYDPQPQAPTDEAGILLRVSGENDGRILADGTSPALVSVFLMQPLAAALRVWLNVDHGQLQQPLVTIPAGEVFGSVKWTSTKPVQQAKVTVSTTSPAIPGIKDASATVDFVDPIVGIAFANPPSRVSIVEVGTLAVRFVDKNANPVAANSPLGYRFSANSAHVQLAPSNGATTAGAFDFSTAITPSGLGSVTVEAAVQGLQPVRQTIEVTGMLLLAFCALAGAVGSLVNHLDFHGKGVVASMLTGAIVALPVTWLYVWVGLPNINAAFMHNQFSALMIAVIAGVAGASGLKAAAKLFGIGLFAEPAPPAAGDNASHAAQGKS